jgi:hypothetical protein
MKNPDRIIRHINGRIRLKYGNFRPGTGTRIRCTVIRFNYSIIQCRIRRSFTVLRIRAVFVHRIRAVFISCHESVLYGSRLRAVSALHSRHIIELFKSHNQLPSNDIQYIGPVKTYLFRLISTTTTMVSIILIT